MTIRRWELDGGTGDRHTVLLDERGAWHGWENLCTDLPRGLGRNAAVNRLLTACIMGRGREGTYDIMELPERDSSAG